jgi:hypothetical protein
MRQSSNLAFDTGHLDNCGVNMECPIEKIPSFIADISPVHIDEMYDNQDGNAESANNMTMGNTNNKVVAPKSDVVVLAREYKPASSFVSLQKWEGVVTEVNDYSFSATLCDLNEDGAEEIAEFPFEEISADDLNLVKPGGIFSWNIGYYDHKSGQRYRTSLIRFRRLPAWTKTEIERIKKNSSKLREELNWK